MVAELGPYPLCDRCKERNGGLVAVRHRQVHVRIGDKESCVDEGLAGVIALLWTVSDTLTACEDHEGRALVVATPETVDAAERALVDLGVAVEREGEGALYFQLPKPVPTPAQARVSTLPAARGDSNLVVAMATAAKSIAVAADRLAANTVGIEHPLIARARSRLDTARTQLTAAMHRNVSPFQYPSGLQRASGVVLGMALAAITGWIGAWIGGVVSGGSTAWSIVGGFAALSAVAWPYIRLQVVAEHWVGQLRVGLTRRKNGLVGPTERAPAERADILLPVSHRLGRIRDSINATRSEIGALAVRYVSAQRMSPSSTETLVWLLERDRVLSSIAIADAALCQASDAIRIWLSLPRG